MDKASLKKGTRIYYTGDQANHEGFGAITHRSTGRYGVFVTVLLDDGRKFESLSANDFSDTYKGDYSTRFVTEEAYKKFRRAQFEKIETDAYKGLVKRTRDTKKTVSDERLDELLEDASREAEKRGDPEKPSDHIAEWHQVFNTLHADWDKGKIDDNKILMYMESLARSFIRTLDKKEVSKNELQCKACHSWRQEDTWGHEYYDKNDYLACPNCGVWNKGDIEARPIERSKSVSAESIIKGRS